MNHALRVAVCSVALAAAPGKALDGVSLPEHVTVDEKPLVLNGAGARIRIFFRVYAAALYLEHASKDSESILSEDATRRLHVVMLKEQERKQLADPIRVAFLKNRPPEELAALKPKLEKLLSLLPATAKNGDVVSFTYIPGQGTTVSSGPRTVIPGKAFADALFSVWLGSQPVDEDLKKSLLGS